MKLNDPMISIVDRDAADGFGDHLHHEELQ